MSLHCNTDNVQRSRIPIQVLLFVVTYLTVVFVGFLLTPTKVKADAINGLKYYGAKMARYV